jgi:hypothetical protein
MTNLLIYNPKLIWSEHFDKNNNIKYDLTDYDSDHEINKDNDCEKDKIDILDSNFSIDNEKILIKIDEIINNTDFNKYNSIEILKMQDIIISYLNKYVVQNNILDKIFFVKLLSWLENSSNELANKIKLKRISHAFVNTKIPSIPRSSYKFCNFKDSCQYNYDDKKEGCYADHFVHNMVRADIEALIKYINLNSDATSVTHNKEIIKCINTVSYVIHHMYDELKNVCLYCKNKKNIDQYHKNRHVSIKKNKKFYKSNKNKKYKKNTFII